MITLSKGSRTHSFEYVVASGGFNLDGKGYWHEKLLGRSRKIFDPSLFTVVTKTLTYGPNKGNFKMYWPWGCIRPIFQRGRMVGTVNAVGLSNPGIFWWCQNIGPTIDKDKIPIIVSIHPTHTCDVENMVTWINPHDVVGIELNESCPNIEDGIQENPEEIARRCEIIYRKSRHPLILKLSVLHDPDKIIPLVRDYVVAISINSVPWNIVYYNSDKKSPLAHLSKVGGGVSGKIAQKHTWPFMKEVIDAGKIPVIGPSVWDYEDMGELRNRGAGAVSFGSIFIRNFTLPTRYVREEIEKENVRDIVKKLF